MPCSIQQSTAAKNILEVFITGVLRYAMLIAFCQAGKTGAFQELIRLMLAAGVVKQVYILCGSNETELKDQAHEDTKAANVAAYVSGAIKVLFRQDFKGATMDVANSLVVVDESHMDQTQKQELDIFLGRHGLTMDGNPRTLNEKNAFIVSVDATPYSELAAVEHKESFPKHIEELKVGNDYFGLEAYYYGGLIKPAFDIVSKVSDFEKMVVDGGNKYVLARFHNGKRANMQEIAAIASYTRIGGKVCYFTADKTEITIESLKDAPLVPTLIIIRGRLRAGKVVAKKHIAFVWEGAKTSKTDALVQGLAGRMCGYPFSAMNPYGYGDEKPFIFLPPNSLKRNENKVIKASEIERAIMPFVLPTLGTNLKKGHIAAAATNGKTQCPPLRLTWDAADDDWTFTKKFEEANRTGATRSVIQERCYALLLKNLDAIRSSSNYSVMQKTEILESIVPSGYDRARLRHLRSDANGDSQVSYFKQLREATESGTAVAEHIGDCDPLNFIITYEGYKAPHANHRHLYVIFYTNATNGAAPSLMAVNLKSRIPETNHKSVFSIHSMHFDTTPVAGGVVGFDESKIKTPRLLEDSLRGYLVLHRGSATSGLVVARCIQSVSERFKLSKGAFHYTSPKQNDVEVICGTLSREFGVKLKVCYTRSAADYFNIKKIEW
jgi:hypothetical protein